MSADEALQEYKQQYPNAISHMGMLLSNTETPSFMTTLNADQLEYTLFDILGKPTHLSQSPPSTPPMPQSTIKDVFVNDFQPTAMSQKDLSLDLHPSVTQLGQLHENLAQQLPQSQTDQTQVNDVPRSIDLQITVVSGVFWTPHLLCQGPSHGGSYMDEGMSYIKIGLFPVVVPGDYLALPPILCLPH